jgi:hypothetical protein
MTIFEVKYESSEQGDLYAISIVDSPANGFEFIAMNDKVKIKLAEDKKKQILYGIVLRPEQLIYREFEDGTPFNLKFSKETIERLSQDFLAKGYQLNSTFDHKGGYLDGTCVVEQWIVSDPNNDKANALGLPIQEGDWVVGMKLSDELWSQYIETGKAKGFSIDSFLDLQKVSMSMNKNNKFNKKEKMSLLKKLIKMFSEGINLETISIEGMGELTADAFEVGNIVYQDVEGVMEPLVSYSFEYEGFKYLTDESGAIVAKEEIVVEEMPVEDVVPAEEVLAEEITIEVGEDHKEETPATESADAVEEIASEVADQVTGPIEEVDVEALRAMIAELQSQLEILSKEKETIISENVAMKEQLSTIPNSSKLKTNEVKMSKKETTIDVLRAVIEAGKK